MVFYFLNNTLTYQNNNKMNNIRTYNNSYPNNICILYRSPTLTRPTGSFDSGFSYFVKVIVIFYINS